MLRRSCAAQSKRESTFSEAKRTTSRCLSRSYRQSHDFGSDEESRLGGMPFYRAPGGVDMEWRYHVEENSSGLKLP